ncbi:MAG TPA: Asd/ArgC dimerization domain-containing protein [Terriglobia bacterium]|nr:Asd/ArgC dimerization domain-containing protein [Terriglobia bacterium]
MKTSAGGLRVAVIGASSLLGKELLSVLEERKFPISRLVTPGALEDAEPDLPVLDLSGGLEAVVAEADVGESDLDFVFLAAPVRRSAKKGMADSADDSSFLQSTRRLAAATRCKVIDLSDCLAGESGGGLSVPFLGRNATSDARPVESPNQRFSVSAHSATIVIGAIILRLGRQFPVKSVVAQVFQPVSEMGAQAIDELQKQTLNLLSFQKIPQAVFGAQLAFNLLPRLGRNRGNSNKGLGGQLQSELATLLGSSLSIPAVGGLYAPVFHSLGCLLYFEFDPPVKLEALTQALAGEPISIRKATDAPPTQVDVSGSSDIVVDVLTPDGFNPGGVWVWAVADNLRLTAVNAVEIAEGLNVQPRTPTQEDTKASSANPTRPPK